MDRQDDREMKDDAENAVLSGTWETLVHQETQDREEIEDFLDLLE